MDYKDPKVLGFYKETDGDEVMIGELKGAQNEFYVELPSGFRNRMEIVVGNRIRIILDSILDRDNHVIREIKKEVIGEVMGYWNELHIPLKEISECDLKKGDFVRIVLKSVIQFGEERRV